MTMVVDNYTQSGKSHLFTAQRFRRVDCQLPSFDVLDQIPLNYDNILGDQEHKRDQLPCSRCSGPLPLIMPVDILDKYYLAITLLITTGYQLLGFAIAWTFQFDKITDFTGGEQRAV
jgi:hypothetical protein